MFGLFVRFTCKDEAAARHTTSWSRDLDGIKANELGTLVYASHTVEG